MHVRPLSCATAERLWAGQHPMDIAAAAPRIEEQRCRMMAYAEATSLLYCIC